MLGLKREIDQIARDKGIDAKEIIAALEEAMKQAARREQGQDREIEAKYRGFVSLVADRIDEVNLPHNSLGQEPTTHDQAVARLQNMLELHLLAFIKPYRRGLPEGDPENYYMEREWRKHGNL